MYYPDETCTLQGVGRTPGLIYVHSETNIVVSKNATHIFFLPGMVGRLLVLNTRQSVKYYVMQSNESFVKSGMLKSMCLYNNGWSTACDWLKGHLWDMAMVTLV